MLLAVITSASIPLSAATIRGKAYVDEEAVPGVTVGLKSASGTRSTTTDSTGKYSFDDVVAGQYTIEGDLMGVSPRSQVCVGETDLVEHDIQLSVKDSCCIFWSSADGKPIGEIVRDGVVLDDRGDPLAYASVIVHLSADHDVVTMSDASGCFHIATSLNLPTLVIEAFMPGYQRSTATFYCYAKPIIRMYRECGNR